MAEKIALITPEGTATMAQMFRESIARTNEKIDRLDLLALLIDSECRSVLSDHMEDQAVDDIIEAAYALSSNEQQRARELQIGLDECELCLEAGVVLRWLDSMRTYAARAGEAVQEQMYGTTIALIGKLDEERKKR